MMKSNNDLMMSTSGILAEISVSLVHEIAGGFLDEIIERDFIITRECKCLKMK